MRNHSAPLELWRQLRPSSLRICSSRRSITRRSLLTQARAQGPLHPPLLEDTIGEHFAKTVSANGDRPAVISRPQGRLTYSQLDADSNVLAHGLQSLGVSKGDRVAVSLGNNLEFATLTYVRTPSDAHCPSCNVISAFSQFCGD
jgi:non-ribosomal peptide synthetase component F